MRERERKRVMAQRKKNVRMRLTAAALSALLCSLGVWHSAEAQTAPQPDKEEEAVSLNRQAGAVFGAGSLSRPQQAQEQEEWKGDRVWLGGNQWRVLETGERLLLLSEEILESGVAFHEEGKAASWEESSLRRRLNSTQEDGYLGQWFSQQEQSAILSTQIQTGEETTQDSLFLLSAEDMEKTEYGFYGDASRASRDGSFTGDWWWLRTPGYDGNDAANVYYNGGVDRDGYMVSYGEGGLRPALYLDAGAIELMVPPGEETPAEGDGWRLFLKGGETGFFAETETPQEEPALGGSLTVSFAGASEEYDQTYGVIYTQEEEILYFGRIADSGSGKAKVEIPQELEAGKEYRLGLFAGHMEEERGSGFASNMAEIVFTPVEAGVLEELQVELEIREDGVYLKAMEEQEGVRYFYRVTRESGADGRPAYGDSLEELGELTVSGNALGFTAKTGTVSGNAAVSSKEGLTVSGNLPAQEGDGVWKEFSEDTKIEEAARTQVYVQVIKVKEGKITGWGEARTPAVEELGEPGRD